MADEYKVLRHTAAQVDDAVDKINEFENTMQNDEAALAAEIARAKEAEAINRSSIGMQKKNILKQGAWLTPDFWEKKNGVTLTANEDKSISLNGTATGDGMNEIAGFLITEGSVTNSNSAEKGSYILSGCPSDGANSGALFLLAYKKTTGEVIMTVGDKGNSATFSVEEDFYYRVFVCYKEGAVFDNVTFYPMLRSEDITDDTYEPYTPSLQERVETLKYEAGKDADDLAKYMLANEDARYEMQQNIEANASAIEALRNEAGKDADDLAKYMLANEDAHYELRLNIDSNTENVAALQGKTAEIVTALSNLDTQCDVNNAERKNDIAVNASSIGMSRKNLLPNNASSSEKNGITFTVNADGSVTAAGTATANTNFDVAKLELTAGESYILTGCPSGGTESTFNLYALYTSTWAGIGGRDTGTGYEFTAKSGELVFRIYIASGTTIENLTFFPMLRYTDISDGTYEQYTPSIFEYIKALEARIAALEAAEPTATTESEV